MPTPDQLTTTDYEERLAQFNTSGGAVSKEFRLQLIHHNRFLILRIEGRVNHHSFQGLIGQAKQILHLKPVEGLVVDLSLCEHVASAAIGFIAFMMMEVARTQGRICVVRANPAITKMFKVLGLDGVYETHDDVDAVIG
jgi:anti-anti-sigma factor